MKTRIEVAKVEDRYILIRVLAANGYTVRIVDDKVDGKRKTFVEFWKD